LLATSLGATFHIITKLPQAVAHAHARRTATNAAQTAFAGADARAGLLASLLTFQAYLAPVGLDIKPVGKKIAQKCDA